MILCVTVGFKNKSPPPNNAFHQSPYQGGGKKLGTCQVAAKESKVIDPPGGRERKQSAVLRSDRTKAAVVSGPREKVIKRMPARIIPIVEPV